MDRAPSSSREPSGQPRLRPRRAGENNRSFSGLPAFPLFPARAAQWVSALVVVDIAMTAG